MVNIEIDGVTMQVPSGTMIIEAADTADIYIPRFCYHKKLSIAANCRMCLVEVEKAKKPLPACATPISEGMKIFTRSPKAIEAQKAVMEFLLINHPLDCPICDQGGECELQDLSMGFGRDSSLFTEGKRAFADEDIGPLIETDMTRCIHCTRCVRFGQEIAGIRELGLIGRGELTEIATYVKHTLKSELSGNIIDLCPVGALTSKPFRFLARAWELQQTAAIAPHDCVGSNIYVHRQGRQVMRVVPKENESINEMWLSDRDRFSYLGLYQDRVRKPLVRHKGELLEHDWTFAFDFIVDGLNKALSVHGADQIAALVSPTATVEELFLLQKFMRALGSNNIDHRVRQTDFADQAHDPCLPGLAMGIHAIEEQDRILLIGSHIQHEQPLLAHRVRKATLNNGKALVINPVDFELYFDCTHKAIVHPEEMTPSLAALAKYLQEKTQFEFDEKLRQQIASVDITDAIKAIGDELLTGKKRLLLLGALSFQHPQAATIKALARLIAAITDANIGFLTAGPNSVGAYMAGALPHRGPPGVAVSQTGLNFIEAIHQKLKVFILFGLEPDLDCANSAAVTHALKDADLVIALSAYQSPYLLEYADVILPIVPFTETEGSFINVAGTQQTFAATTIPYEDARPGWKVLRVLGNYFNLEGFEYSNCEQIRHELHTLAKTIDQKTDDLWSGQLSLTKKQTPLYRITKWPIYRGDSIVRRADALQVSASNEALGAYMNNTTAKKQGVADLQEVQFRQADATVTLPLLVDEHIPDDCVLIPAGYRETAPLGEPFGAITICK